MADGFSRRQPQKAYPLPAALRNEFSASLYIDFFCIPTSGIKDPVEALSVYRAKESIENSFDDLKNHLDMKRLRIHTSAAMDCRIFLQFPRLDPNLPDTEHLQKTKY